MLLATTAATRLTILAVLLLWVLVHAGGGLVTNDITEHFNLPLHCIDGGIVVAKTLEHGGVSHPKVGYSISQGGCGCIVLCGAHAVAVLQGWDGCEQRNVDGGFPKGMERGKVDCVGWGVVTCNPDLVFFCKEACAMDDMNADVDNVIVGDGVLGKVGKRCSPKQSGDK